MRAITDGSEYPERAAPLITVHALNVNKKPIGFAPWPEESKKKRKKKHKPPAR